jgi:hypothetical protein
VANGADTVPALLSFPVGATIKAAGGHALIDNATPAATATTKRMPEMNLNLFILTSLRESDDHAVKTRDHGVLIIPVLHSPLAQPAQLKIRM